MKNIILKLLQIRLKQLKAEIIALGFLYLLILIAAILFLFFFCWSTRNSLKELLIVSGILAIVILTFQINRKDDKLLALISNKASLLRFTEYIIVLIPFLLIFSFGAYPWISLLLFIFSFIVSFLEISSNNIRPQVLKLKFIPPAMFEWRSGIRSGFYPLLLLYSLSWLLIPLPYVSLVLIWLLTAIAAGFYQLCEAQDFLSLVFKEKFSLWKNKIFPAMKLFLLLITPQLILYSIFHSQHWFIVLIEFVLLIIIFIFNIISKYAFYRPNEESTAIKLYTGLAQISVIIPFLIPLPFLLSFVWYNKAIRNIRSYICSQ